MTSPTIRGAGTRRASGREALALYPDQPGYWAAYAASLAQPPEADPPGGRLVPVWTRHEAATRQVLAACGVPVHPGPNPPVPPWAHALGHDLAALADGDLRRVESLHRRLRALRPGPDRAATGWVVGVGGPGAALGLLRAVADRRPYLAVPRLGDPRVHGLSGVARSVYVVAEHLDLDEVANLCQVLDASAGHQVLPGVPACPVGYLHARDLAAMALLDAKQRLTPHGGVDLVVDATATGAPTEPGPGVVTAPYRLVGHDTVARVDSARLITLTAHGMSDLVHLNNDYVCGASPYGHTPDGHGRLPSCVATPDGRCFHKPTGRPVPAHRLPADHVFVNSCGSLRFASGDFGPAFTLWYAAVDGRARSYVGTTRWKDGHGMEGVLYRHLLRAGFTLGEAVVLLNHAVVANQIEAEPVYALLGDPDERIAEPAGPGGPAEPVGDLRPERQEVAVRHGRAWLSVTDPGLLASLARRELLVDVTGPVPFFTTAVPRRDGRGAHLLVFSASDHDGPVRVRALDFGAEFRAINAARRALEGTLDPVLGMQGLYPDRVRQGGRKNLQARLLQISRLYRARFTQPDATRRLLATARTFRAELNRVDADIAQWLTERIRTTSYRFSEHYQDNFLPAGDPSGPDRCPECGGQVVRRELRHVLRPDLCRTELICRRCGGIGDVPDDSVTVRIDAPARWVRGTEVAVRVLLASLCADPTGGHCLAAVRRSAGMDLRQPDPVAVRIPPGGAAGVPFRFGVGPSVLPHQYDLHVAVVSQTRIYLARRALWVG